MDRQYPIGAGGLFSLHALREEELGEAVALCDQCVGENMYTREELAQAITSENRFFFLLKTDEGKIAGYIYYYLTDVESVAKHAKLSTDKLEAVCPVKNAPVGKLQSIGLREEYRKSGLAAQMLDFALNDMRRISIGTAFIICWKINGFVPLEGTLRKCSFSHLAEAKKIWYDMTDLVCPVCRGRCHCDAEVYYKRIDQEGYNET